MEHNFDYQELFFPDDNRKNLITIDEHRKTTIAIIISLQF